MFSFPAALIVGVVGIIYDRRKLLAIIATIIASGFLLYYLCAVGIIMVCR